MTQHVLLLRSTCSLKTSKKYIPAKICDHAFLKQHCLVYNKVFFSVSASALQKKKKKKNSSHLLDCTMFFFTRYFYTFEYTLGLFFCLNQLLPVHSNAVTSEPWKFDSGRHKHVPGDRLSLSVAISMYVQYNLVCNFYASLKFFI